MGSVWRRRAGTRRRGCGTSREHALDDAPVTESRALRLVDGARNAVERSEMQRDAAEPLQAVADPVAAELENVLALRRTGADPKALRRALRRIEELSSADANTAALRHAGSWSTSGRASARRECRVIARSGRHTGSDSPIHRAEGAPPARTKRRGLRASTRSQAAARSRRLAVCRHLDTGWFHRVAHLRSTTCRSFVESLRRVRGTSGGIDGRPVALYIASKSPDRRANAWSASAFTCRSGCADGTAVSGDRKHSIEACFVSVPRIAAAA